MQTIAVGCYVCTYVYIAGLKPSRVIHVIRVNRITFCPGQVGLTRFIRYPGLTRILHCISRALMMVSDSGDDGSVFPNSAQDVSNLVTDDDRIRKEVEHGSNFESC